MSIELPAYSPSFPAPEYTSEPLLDESRLQITPKRHRRHWSEYMKQTSLGNVIFKDQEDGISIPTYGRGCDISGDIVLENQHHITTVFVKVP